MNRTLGIELEPQVPKNSFLAPGSKLEGIFTSTGECLVDCEVLGNVTAQKITVNTNGKIQGNLRAQTIVVQGAVIGDLQGDIVHLMDGASVSGQLNYSHLSIAFGAKVCARAIPNKTSQSN